MACNTLLGVGLFEGVHGSLGCHRSTCLFSGQEAARNGVKTGAGPSTVLDGDELGCRGDTGQPVPDRVLSLGPTRDQGEGASHGQLLGQLFEIRFESGSDNQAEMMDVGVLVKAPPDAPLKANTLGNSHGNGGAGSAAASCSGVSSRSAIGSLIITSRTGFPRSAAITSVLACANT